MSFEAKYAGFCYDCREMIEPGQRVEYRNRTLCHVDCDAEPIAPLVGNQCPKCHLTMPLSGVCDCEDY